VWSGSTFVKQFLEEHRSGGDEDMSDRASKDALFEGFALVGKALASGRRAELVDVLAQGERSVEDLAGEIGQSVANTSQHLQQLLRAGLVRTRRQGTRVFYALSSDRVTQLWLLLREVAEEHVDELDGLARAYLGDRGSLRSMTQAELRRRLRVGDVVVIDVRPPAEYAAGHIRGARSVPLPDLARRLRDVPKDTEVVAYCRGPYCVYADDAVRALRRRGYQACRLEDGFPEWARAGLPVQTQA
jgi:rhodanese-related sulfurtransferase/DNA-binding transcriptional ArsR family regulator